MNTLSEVVANFNKKFGENWGEQRRRGAEEKFAREIREWARMKSCGFAAGRGGFVRVSPKPG